MSANQDAQGAGTPQVPSEKMYVIFMRQIGTEEWHSQHSNKDRALVEGWLENCRQYNAKTYEPGCGREYILTLKTTTYETL